MRSFHTENLILFQKVFQFCLDCSRFDHDIEHRMFIMSLLCYRIFISERRLTVRMTSYKTRNFYEAVDII